MLKMAPDEIIKAETDNNEAQRLLNSASRDEVADSLVNLPDPTGATPGVLNLDPPAKSTEPHSSTSRACTSPAPAPNSLVKLEMKPTFAPIPWPTYLNLPKQLYDDFATAADINYTPQAALEQAFLMLKRIEDCIKQLNMHTELRRIMWRKKINELKTYKHGYITIAICGSTGAGKSSLINAMLDAHILPTSDSRACTSAIVEVRYHRHPFYSAEIEFFTRGEWVAEMEKIIEDIQSKLNPDGDHHFDPEFVAYVEAAWQKMHVVYLSLTRRTLGTKKPDEIIDSDPISASLLGTIKTIQGKTPAEFRGKLAVFITARSATRQTPTGPQLWPLVKKVRVYVNCAALESGSRLVDLPGTGDVNEARNSVAKGYLKEADYIWVVASIKRAADESMANELIDENLKTDLRHNKYDHQHIAFIATGSDHVSEREIIESLELEQDPDLLEIQAELAGISEALKEGRSEADTPAGQNIVLRLEERRAHLKKHRKQTLARKRNENMKKVLKQKFRSALAELESDPYSDNPRVQTSLTDFNSIDVPVYTCSAYDYVGLNTDDDYEPVTRMNAPDSSTRGFSSELRQVMQKVIEDCVAYLKQDIRGAFEELFLKGAAEAEARALAIHDLFAPRITHWATYRATLRRCGEFRRNLNEELVAPITRRQLEIWPQTFRKQLLAPMAKDAKLSIERMLAEVKRTSPPAVYAHCEPQCQLALQEAQATINEIEQGLMKLIVQEQRTLSRFLAPAIRDILDAAYHEAIEIRGRKSTELQKNLFRGHIDTLRRTMFTDGVTRLMEKLDYIPNAIGIILPVALSEVACQTEVNLASLWQIPELGKEEVEKRKEFISETTNILRQARLWLTVIPTQ
ncbi:unnamed protein product [Rhizoctonia solani]|uniref:Dynamin N-terminal domain-containing protein n=1 Tax=Rhizoctonia solani TaxID=456999 RepID=A0A8H2WPM7_9AGAM|nr:unnamed protein product [Rhizoctonia solani]